MTSALGGQAPAAPDAVMFFEDAAHPLPDAVAGSGAAVVLFGAKEDDARVHSVPARADANGLSPTLSMAIQGWLFTAELVSACAGQDAVYETIGLYGGIPRMEQYQGKGIFFHDGPAPPRVLANVLAEEYIKRVSVMLRRCEKECRSNLDRAGQWAGRAIERGEADDVQHGAPLHEGSKRRRLARISVLLCGTRASPTCPRQRTTPRRATSSCTSATSTPAADVVGEGRGGARGVCVGAERPGFSGWPEYRLD